MCYHRVLIMTGCWTWRLFILFPTSLSKGIEHGFPSRFSQLQPEFFSVLGVFCACRNWYSALLMETKSGWMSQTCKTSSAILAAAPPLPDPRPKALVWSWIMVFCLCGPIWLVAIPCGTGLAASIPKGWWGLQWSQKILLGANDSPKSHPGHLGVTGSSAPFIFDFFNPTCGVWQNFRSLCFSFGISPLEVGKFMPGNGWDLKVENINSRHGELLKEQEFHGNKTV